MSKAYNGTVCCIIYRIENAKTDPENQNWKLLRCPGAFPASNPPVLFFWQFVETGFGSETETFMEGA